MHNFWVRLNNVVFFGIGVLLCMAAMCSMSSWFHTAEPVVKTLKINTLKSLKNSGGADRALFTFDLSADLRPAFHWNVHQLFVFVVAEYYSKSPSKNAPPTLNEVIIWDRILPASPSTGHAAADLRISNEHVKYALAAQGDELRGANVTLRLLWDHMPITGKLYTGGARDLGTAGPSTWSAGKPATAAGSSTFTLPKRMLNQIERYDT